MVRPITGHLPQHGAPGKPPKPGAPTFFDPDSSFTSRSAERHIWMKRTASTAKHPPSSRPSTCIESDDPHLRDVRTARTLLHTDRIVLPRPRPGGGCLGDAAAAPIDRLRQTARTDSVEAAHKPPLVVSVALDTDLGGLDCQPHATPGLQSQLIHRCRRDLDGEG